MIGEKGFPSFREEKSKPGELLGISYKSHSYCLLDRQMGTVQCQVVEAMHLLPVGTQQITSALSMLGQARQQAFFF